MGAHLNGALREGRLAEPLLLGGSAAAACCRKGPEKAPGPNGPSHASDAWGTAVASGRAAAAAAAAPLPQAAAPGSQASSAPPSFKASRPRKTKDFIGSARQHAERHGGWEYPADVDPRLVEDANAHEITAKVASLIFHHVQEGAAAAGGEEPGPADDEFHEAHFLRRSWCSRCLPRRGGKVQRVSEEAVFVLIDDIATSLYFCKQVVVLCAVYIERLLQGAAPLGHESSTQLTSSNWRCIVVVALLVASKVWEDVHPWNADVEECLQEVSGIRYQPGALYRLESLLLDKLRWKVFVDGEVYAAYFFSLKEGGRPGGDATSPCQLRRQHRRHTSDGSAFGIDTIMEDELYINSDSEPERGIFPEGTSSSISYRSSRSGTPPLSPNKRAVPWSRDDMVASWRKEVLESEGDACGAALRAGRDAWKLDAGNPHIGALRHAPRALAPSRHAPQSEELLWAHRLASRSADVFGPRSSRPSPREGGAARTLSGATGTQLAEELRRYLDSRGAVAAAACFENVENGPPSGEGAVES